MIRDVGRIVKEVGKHLSITRFQEYTVEQFTQWVQHRANVIILTRYHESFWKRYSNEFFKKGISRVYQDSTYNRRDGIGIGNLPDGGTVGGMVETNGKDTPSQREYGTILQSTFQEGRKEQFVRQTLGREEVFKTIQLLQAKAWQEVVGATTDLVHKLTRAFTDSIIKKLQHHETSHLFQSIFRVYVQRLNTIINTEGIRIHAEGQLCAMEELGEIETGIEPEELNGNESCKKCSETKGKIFTLQDAHGLIPFHPNCYCCWSIK